MKKLILLILLIPSILFAGPLQQAHKKVIAGQTVADGCNVTGTDIKQTDDISGYVKTSNSSGVTQGQSFTVPSGGITFAKIDVAIKDYAAGADFTIRIGSSLDLTDGNYTEEIEVIDPSNSNDYVTFVSSANPTLTAGKWYFAIRQTGGTDGFWLRGQTTGTYSGGGRMSGSGGTTTWVFYDFEGTEDVGFLVYECE